MGRYFLGLISGTSVDGVDAALCEFGEHRCTVVAAQTFAYPPAIAERIQALIRRGEARLTEIGAIDIAVGRYFADAALALLRRAGVDPGEVAAIGHHGQTIWHEPRPPEAFSWQIGDPNSVAAITGIDTIADLRRLDMALGGQGAPLVPAFHQWLFASATTARTVLNIGGIANLTLLAPGRDVLGFDTGPGNTLLDALARRCLGQPFDDRGRWAASGKPNLALLEILLREPYFARPAPKSTGRELFNESWLEQNLEELDAPITDVNLAATLLELTARSIVDALAALGAERYPLIVCGGGASNDALMARLGAQTGTVPQTTAAFGLDPDFVEAAAMAWLAHARVTGCPGNLPTVTAAREATILGGLYCGVKKPKS
jgi:anhydro-N-acetylmuramic acid kinase